MTLTRRETAILLVGDFCILVVSLWLALFLRNLSLPTFSYFEENFLPFLPIFFLSLAVFYIAGLYEKQTTPVRRRMGERVLGAQIANSILAALIFFILPLTIAPKTILLLYLIVSVAGVSWWRIWRAKRERHTGQVSKAILIAEGSAAQELYEEVNGNDRYLLGFSERVKTESNDLKAKIKNAIANGVSIVVLDTRDPGVARSLPSLDEFILSGATFVEFAALYEEIFDRVPLDHIDSAWMLECLPRRHAAYDFGKRTFDIVMALAGLIVASPFVLLSALVLVPGGPAFFMSERVGRDGKLYRNVKLRTMLFNDGGDPERQKKNRITAFGKFLRRSRIDELPQLWNVLAGDISFIGPRPELPAIAKVYEHEIPFYNARHLIPPGLSGFAQIRHADPPKGAADVARTRVKLSYDLYYLKHRSFGLDLAIAVKTLREIASFSGK